MRAEETKLGVALREVRTSRKKIETPQRALSLTVSGYSEALADLHPSTQGLVEFYRELAPPMLSKLHESDVAQADFAGEMSRRVGAVTNKSSVVLGTFAFREKGFTPKEKQVDYLADLVAAPFFDAVAVPAVLPRDRDAFLGYAKAFVAAFDRIDHIPLLGYLPNFAYRDILRAVDAYLKMGVKDFVLEFNGHHAGVMYPNVQGVTRVLRKEIGDEFMLHGLNVGPGAFRRKVDATPSKDFLALLAGVDSMGAKHVRKKMPAKVWKKLAAQPDKGRRLFSRRDYGYYDPRAYRRRFGSKPDGGVIRPAAVCGNPEPTAVQLFNAERQGIEALSLREHLRKESLLDYARSKAMLRPELDKVASGTGQQTLAF